MPLRATTGWNRAALVRIGAGAGGAVWAKAALAAKAATKRLRNRVIVCSRPDSLAPDPCGVCPILWYCVNRTPTIGDQQLRPHTSRRFSMRLLALAGRFGLLAILGLTLAGCGVNNIPSQEEAAKAKWSQVLNQYQRRADLIPNLVETVKGYAK